MSKSRNDVKVYLIDIRNSCLKILKILKYTKNVTKSEFLKNHMLSDAVEKNLLVIGEAASKIPQNIKIEYNEIPWKTLTGIRNKIIHKYFDINIDTIWESAIKDVPILRRQILRILRLSFDS